MNIQIIYSMKTKPYAPKEDEQIKVSEPIVAYTKTGTSFSIDTYWDMLKDLSTDIKLKLIARLSNSIVENKVEEDSNELLADRFYGVWKDDKSAEELINEIRNSRVLGTRHLESFE